MLFKTIIFSDVPVLKGFKYRNRFQLVPFFYSESAPRPEHTGHFPVFLEYEVETIENEYFLDDILYDKGFTEEQIKNVHFIPYRKRVKKEIVQLLTCLTNFHFFIYDSFTGIWGIQLPSNGLNKMKSKEWEGIEMSESKWTIGCYRYPGWKDDLQIEQFSKIPEHYDTDYSSSEYYTNNPGKEYSPKLSFPRHIEQCLDNYYQLEDEIYRRTKYCMNLLADGIALFDTKCSVSFLSIISSIEGMALLDNELYGENKKLRVTKRFKRYLQLYVAGKSTDKFEAYYEKRCEIAHEGDIFISDYDIYSNIDEQNEEWGMRLEAKQIARIGLYNWLRRKQTP